MFEMSLKNKGEDLLTVSPAYYLLGMWFEMICLPSWFKKWLGDNFALLPPALPTPAGLRVWWNFPMNSCCKLFVCFPVKKELEFRVCMLVMLSKVKMTLEGDGCVFKRSWLC